MNLTNLKFLNKCAVSTKIKIIVLKEFLYSNAINDCYMEFEIIFYIIEINETVHSYYKSSYNYEFLFKL